MLVADKIGDESMLVVNKIMYLFKCKECSQKELAEHLNISENKISEWKSGKTKSYKKYLPQIASFFNVSVDYLLDVNNSSSQDESELLNIYRNLTNNGKKQVIDFADKISDMETSEEFFVPTIKIKHSEYTVSAGVGDEIGDYEYWETVEIPKTREAVKSDFCLTIKGNSMIPKFENGDVILVKDQPTVDIGQICIYNINNKGYIKKFGGDRLISLNPDYDDIILSKNTDDIVKCCGLVLGKTTIIE